MSFRFGPPEPLCIAQADGSMVMGRCPVAWLDRTVGCLERLSVPPPEEAPDMPPSQVFMLRLESGTTYSASDLDTLLDHCATVIKSTPL